MNTRTPRVERFTSPTEVVKMSKGLSGTEWEEPRIAHRVYDAEGRYVATVGNSTLLCLPGRSVRATEATDAEIIEAVLNDEPIFPNYGAQS